MRIENMAQASVETMRKLGFYWGGASYDEDKPRWIGIETIGSETFVVIVAYAVDGNGWFAEAYDLFDLDATVDGWQDGHGGPQDQLDGLIERLKEIVKQWEKED